MALPPPATRLLPSVKAAMAGAPDEAQVSLTMRELRALLDLALDGIAVDEAWYLQQYADVREGITRGGQTATQHYRKHGWIEGRLPADPAFDEDWYRATNPDVAAGIRQGKYRTGKEHYLDCGYAEGRAPNPNAEAPAQGAAQPRFVPRPRF